MILLEDFKRRITIITGNEASVIRKKYIGQFVDITSDHFNKYIAVKKRCKDGVCYSGYLWDCLKHSIQVTEGQILNNQLPDQLLYVLWDLHSSNKIFNKDYWKFPKEAILKFWYHDLSAGLSFLPEDIYIFDEGLTWSFVLTHEYDDKDNRFCLRAQV